MNHELSTDVKEVMRENALNLVEIMILEEQPFRIVLWNNDNWNGPLPKRIMNSFPTQIVLDIKDMALGESFIDLSTGEVIITTMFEGIEYQKVLEYDEIIAVLDLNGQPYILNDFKQDTTEDATEEFFIPKIPTTKEEVIEMVVSDGCDKEGAERSFNMFMKNNPELAKRFSSK